MTLKYTGFNNMRDQAAERNTKLKNGFGTAAAEANCI